jgi:hypothetical protein
MQEKGSVSMAEGDMASRLDSLDAQLKSLRDDIANIYSHLKGGEDMKKMEMEDMGPDQPGKVTTNDEEAVVKDFQKKGSVSMSSKKFTGAPVENNQPALNGLLQHKTQDTFSKVLARMANSKF